MKRRPRAIDINRMQRRIVFLAILIFVSYGILPSVYADDDDEKRESRYFNMFDRDDDSDDDDHDEKDRFYKPYIRRYLNPVNNNPYKEQCGECHSEYQPELLPSGSWKKILAGLADHNDETIDLDPGSKRVITKYLTDNAAEYSSSKYARKIMRSLGGRTPLRITDIPYIRKEHDEIPNRVLERESIGSLSNCSVCHRTAERGIYDEKHVLIPR